MRPIRSAFIVVALLATIAGASLPGCGGSSSPGEAPLGQPPTSDIGSGLGGIRVNVAWPTAESRLVPKDCNVILLRVLDKSSDVVPPVKLVRPEPQQGTNETSEVTITDIPPGTYVLQAEARSRDNPKEPPQASGAAPVSIRANDTTSVELTMTGTVESVEVLPNSINLQKGDTQQLTAAARNAQGKTVVATLAWRWQSSAPNVVSVSDDGLITALGNVGSAEIVAIYDEPGHTKASNPVLVTIKGQETVRVNVSPDDAQCDVGGKVQFTATVTGSSNTAVTWSIVESGGGTITNSGLYTSPGVSGTYHVTAVSQADPSASDVSTVIVSDNADHSVQISISPSSLKPGEVAMLYADVANTASDSVVWQVSGGTVDDPSKNPCLYTAGSTPGTYTITATSTEYGTKATGNVDIIADDTGRALLVSKYDVHRPYLQAAGFTQIAILTEVPSLTQLRTYRVVLLEDYQAANPSSAEVLRQYVEDGGGLVMLAGVPFFLSGSSQLQGWMGGGIYTETFGNVTFRKVGDLLGIPHDTILYQNPNQNGGAAISTVSGSGATVIHRNGPGQITGYLLNYGFGRVVFDTGAFIEAQYRKPGYEPLFISMVKYAGKKI